MAMAAAALAGCGISETEIWTIEQNCHDSISAFPDCSRARTRDECIDKTLAFIDSERFRLDSIARFSKEDYVYCQEKDSIDREVEYLRGELFKCQSKQP